jgi:hypothetical protein
MTVVRLSLSGMADAEADQAVSEVLDRRTGPLRLERVLVIDDTSALTGHAPLYQALATSNRIPALMCVAVGPLSVAAGPHGHGGRHLALPGILGGSQGYGVLWVGDPAGIDWRVALVPIANGHPGTENGLDRLLDLLSVDELFDRVHAAFEDQVPGKVASPGLRLAGAEDEFAAFTAALNVAVRRLCAAGSGPDGPFAALLPATAGGAHLAENGPLAHYQDEVLTATASAGNAVAELTRLHGRFRRGDGGLQECLVEARAALSDLRDMVTRLLREADAAGPLTGNQRRLLEAAGIGFEVPVTGTSPNAAASLTDKQSQVIRVISDAIGGGDTLPLVARRLAQTAREVRRGGSAAYLHEVEEACPAALLDRLSDPDPRRSLRGLNATEARQAVGIDEAKPSAQRLVGLVIDVANREWSPGVPDSGAVARARIALEGIRAALTEEAEATVADARGVRGARLSRLADSLLPVLRDLVLRVVADEAASPSASGEEAFSAAHARTTALLCEWVQLVRADGVSATAPFATSSGFGMPSEIEDDVAEIREALLYPAAGEMWQLCEPDDLNLLDPTTPPQVIRFASRLSKEALAGTLPTGEIEWTATGSYAGLLRLVPLKAGVVAAHSIERTVAPPTGVP